MPKSKKSQWAITLLLFALALSLPGFASARADGVLPSKLSSFKVFGSYKAKGESLMTICSDAPEVNCYLLPQSSVQITDLPYDAEIVKSYIWWSGSIDGSVDDTADFTTADGNFYNDLAADTCFTNSAFGGFFYCRKDVTALVDSQGPGSYNGSYTLGDVRALPGNCPTDYNCQARYAGWSLVIVYEAPSMRKARDIIIYDGFYHMDEDEYSSGIGQRFTISDFYVKDPPIAEITYLGFEGDLQLGVPPQNLLTPDHYLYSTTAEDYLKFNGYKLHPLGETDKAGNIWDSSGSEIGNGIDIDTFPIGSNGLNLVRAGDTSATIQPGVGDGIINTPPWCDSYGNCIHEQGFGGESVFLGYIIFAVDTISPMFSGESLKSVIPVGDIAQGDVLNYNIKVKNTGSAVATNVVVKDNIPENASYVANSTFTDCGVSAPDIGGESPLVRGLNIGSLAINASCNIGFKVRVKSDAVEGDYVSNYAVIIADGLTPYDTNTVKNKIVAPVISTPTKKVVDVNGSPTFPNDQLRYTITITNPSGKTLSGVRFTDTLPLHLNIDDPEFDIIVTTGTINFTPPRTIEVSGIDISAGGKAEIRIIARVDTETEFAQKEPGAQINGYKIENQSRVYASGLPSPGYKLTDDPDTHEPNDPTRIYLTTSSGVRLWASTKAVSGGSGRDVLPGEELTYTIIAKNTGDRTANNVTVQDDILNANGLEYIAGSASQPVTVQTIAGGVRLVWGVGELAAGGQSSTLTFRARVIDAVTNGQAVINQGFVSSNEIDSVPTDDPDTPKTGDATVVFAKTNPDFSMSEKLVTGHDNYTAKSGDTLNFTIRLRNTGVGGASNVVVSDPLDKLLVNITNISPAPNATYNAETHTIQWVFPSLGSQEVMLSFSGRVGIPGQPNSVLKNCAYITANEDVSGMVCSPDILIQDAAYFGGSTKKAIDVDGDGIFSPGDDISFRIQIVNSGTVSARDVVVEDVLPVGELTDIVVVDGELSGNTARWQLGTLEAGQKATKTINAKLSRDLAQNDVICNQATITSMESGAVYRTGDPDLPTQPNEEPTCFTIITRPEFLVQKIVTAVAGRPVERGKQATAAPGETIDYSITIKNIGSAPANNVVLTDKIHSELEEVANIIGGSYNAQTREIAFSGAYLPDLAYMPPEKEVALGFSAKVKSNAPNGRSIDNQAYAISDEIPFSKRFLSDDPNTDAPNDPTVVYVVSGGNITESRKDVRLFGGTRPTNVKPGDILEFTVLVQNTGTLDLTQVAVRDTVDADLALDPQSVSHNGAATGNVIRWDSATTPQFATLHPGDSLQLTFSARVRAPASLPAYAENTAYISAKELADDFSVSSPKIEIIAPILNYSTKEARDLNGEPFAPGDAVEYIITLRNEGNADANDIIVEDEMDPFLTDVIPKDGGSLSGNKIVWDKATKPSLAGPLKPGDSIELRFSAKILESVSDGQKIYNQGKIYLPGFDKYVGTDDPKTEVLGDPTIIRVQRGSIYVEKTVTDTNGSPTVPGDALKYTIRISNVSAKPITNVNIEDEIDIHLQSVVADSGGIVGEGYIIWNQFTTPALKELAPQSSATLSFIAVVRNDAPDGTEIANQARVWADGIAETLSDDPATPDVIGDPTVVKVSASAVLSDTTKTYEDLNGGNILPGDEIRYVITIVNSGNAPAYDIVVRDKIESPDMVEVIYIGEGGRWDEANPNIIIWDYSTNGDLTRLDPGKSVILTFTIRIKEDIPDGTKIANQAVVRSQKVEPTNSDDPATPQKGDKTIFTVMNRPYLGDSIKTVSVVNSAADRDGVAYPGDTLEYTIVIKNTGARDATSVKVFDSIPQYTEYVPSSTKLNGMPVPDFADGESPLSFGGLLINSARPGTPAGTILKDDFQPPDDEWATVSFRVKIAVTTVFGTVISNQAEFTADEDIYDVSDNPATPDIKGDPTTVKVGGGADVSATTKSWAFVSDPPADGTPRIGDSIRYTIIVPNAGNSPIKNAIFYDAIPKNSSYIPESIKLNNVRLTDAGDADGGEFRSYDGERGAILINLPPIEVGGSAKISFDIRVAGEPEVSNQGRVMLPDGGEELTDDPTTPEPNDPTSFPVGKGFAKKLALNKSLKDTNGGAVLPGDKLRFTLKVQNKSSTAIKNITLEDHIPAYTNYVVGEDVLPQGVTVTYPESGEGNYKRGLFAISGLTLEAGASRDIIFSVRLDDDLKRGTVVSNFAIASSPDLDEEVLSNTVSVIIGSSAGNGGVMGLFYYELDGVEGFNPNGSQDGKERDSSLSGYTVLIEPLEQRDAKLKPAYSARTGEREIAGYKDINFWLDNIPPGDYRMRIVSDKGVTFYEKPLGSISPGELKREILPFEPTGTVYNRRTGEPFEGVKISVNYSDGAKIQPSELPKGQQDQISDRNGFYKLDLPRGGYILEFQSPAPSVVVPARTSEYKEEVLFVEADGRAEASSVRKPSVGTAGEFYTKFALSSDNAYIVNNHIPVAEAKELIFLEKSANKKQVALGDIVTYTLTLRNNSVYGFTRNDISGGLYITDALPKDFKYIAGSAHIIVSSYFSGNRNISAEGANTTVRPVAVSGERILKIGPFDLEGGETVEIRYQLVAGVAVRRGEYENRAVAQDRGGVVYSNVATEKVRVVYDPIFDEALVIGKVFCDDNDNGWQDYGERGIEGVRVFHDEGVYALTDVAGRYHVSAIQPGYHLIKIDAQSLPLESELTTEETVGIYFTRGILQKVNFGVKCRLEEYGINRFIPAEPTPPQEINLSVETQPPTVVLFCPFGNDCNKEGKPEEGSSKEVRVAFPIVDLHLGTKKGERLKSPLLEPDYDGLKEPLLLTPKLGRGAKPFGWKFSILDIEGREKFTSSGAGAPPESVSFAGIFSDGSLIKPGAYFARFAVTLESGDISESPLKPFAVGGSGEETALSATLSTAGFAEDGVTPGEEMAKELKRIQSLFARYPDARMQIEAHTDSAGDPAEKKARTRMQARAIMYALGEMGADMSRITAVGLGDSKPLVVERSIRDRLKNRRIEIKIIRAVPTGEIEPPPALIPQITANGYLLSEGVGNIHTVPLEEGLAFIEFILPDQSRIKALFRVTPEGEIVSPPPFDRPPAWEEITYSEKGDEKQALALAGSVSARRIVIEKKLFKLPNTKLVMKLLAPVEPASGPIVGLDLSGDAPLNWKIELKNSSGAALRTQKGSGAPPSRLDLSPPSQAVPLEPGSYSLDAELKLKDGSIYFAEPLPFYIPAEDEIISFSVSIFPAAGEAATKRLEQLLNDAPKGFYDERARYTITVPQTDAPNEPTLAKRRAVTISKELRKRGVKKENVKIFLLGKEDKAPITVVKRLSGEGEEPRSFAKLGALTLPALADGSFEGRLPIQKFIPGRKYPFLLAQPSGEKISGEIKMPPPIASGIPAAAKAESKFAKRTVDTAKYPIAALKAFLPPQGSVLKNTKLHIVGKAPPKSKVEVNRISVETDKEGNFSQALNLAEGSNEIVISAIDEAGNRAEIAKSYIVDTDRFFIMALGEGTTGRRGSEPEGLTEHDTWYPESLHSGAYLHGRGVLYMKGEWKSETLFERYGLTAHIDSAKQREENFFDQRIDPDKYYPTYGDSAQEVKDVNAKDKLYLLITADNSKLLVGNYQTSEMKGPEFFKLNRTYYGALLDFNETVAENFKTRAQSFATQGEDLMRHRSLTLKSTGGSVYYMKDRNIIEGSERISVVAFDASTGIPLSERYLERQADYDIDYDYGRIIFKQAPSFYAGDNPTIVNTSGGELKPGNPVFISVDYDYLDMFNEGGAAYGVYLREKFFDLITVGGGFLTESASRDSADDYRLFGVELGFDWGQKTRLISEFAKSHSRDGVRLYSDDGGLVYTYTAGSESEEILTSQGRLDGSAYKAEFAGDFGEYFGIKDDFLAYNLYFRNIEPGFFANDLRVEQGFMKYGGLSRWFITREDILTLRHDGFQFEYFPQPIEYPDFFRRFHKESSIINYTKIIGDWKLAGEFGHSYLFDSAWQEGAAYLDTTAAGVGYNINPRWLVFGEQEVVVNTTERLHPTRGDMFTTTAGSRYKLSDKFELSAVESVRPSGANATTAGVRAYWNKTSSVYTNERFVGHNRNFFSTSTVGVEEAASPTALSEVRTYGEYQLDASGSGEVNRLVLGMNNSWEVTAGLRLTVNYERQQVAGSQLEYYRDVGVPMSRGLIDDVGVPRDYAATPDPAIAAYAGADAPYPYLADPTAVFNGTALPYGSNLGDSSRDVGAVGAEFLRLSFLKASTKFELRFDNGDELMGGMDKIQFLTMNGLALQILDDVSLVGKLNYVITNNLTLELREGRVLEASAGIAFRPRKHDWINIITKYTKLIEQRPLSLTAGVVDESDNDVFTIMPVVDTPLRLKFTEKLAVKRAAEIVGSLPEAVSVTLLWINRLDFDVWRRKIALGGEYRVLKNFLIEQSEAGWLAELSVLPAKYLRIGVGYNFTSFSDNEFARQDYDYGGFFFRLAGQY
ncbi:MAG: hypothetical protein Kow0090_02120 [Myxococcota bacterium]